MRELRRIFTYNSDENEEPQDEGSEENLYLY